MTPDEAVQAAESGRLAPVYVIVGPERREQARVLGAIRSAVDAEDRMGLGTDQLVAGETDVDAVLSKARTLPMLAPRRLVVVRSVERWEARGDAQGGSESPLDRLAAYAADPVETTTMVLLASKLDARRRLMSAAKKGGFLVQCQPPARNALPGWVAEAAKRRGKRLAPGVAHLLAELLGPELSPIEDALERLSLYVGDGDTIDEDAVAECVVEVKPATVWELVGAVGRGDLGTALRVLGRVYDPKDRGLRLVGVLAWSTRQLVRFAAARAEGLSPPDAAKRAGAPPFKARELEAQARELPAAELSRWLETLANVDLALKGGSRRPPRAVLESAVIALCTARRAAAHPAARAQ